MKLSRFAIFLAGIPILFFYTMSHAQKDVKDYYNGPYAISEGNVEWNLTIFDFTALQRESTELITSRVILNANNTLIEKTQDPVLIDYQIYLINNIINTARLSSGMFGNTGHADDYLGWIEFADGVEKPLYESYPFVFIAKFLYMMQQSGWKDQNEENKQWWESTLKFVEEQEWEKWGKRSYYKYSTFIRTRTYMGSHWATIAMYLKEMSKDQNRIAEYIEVQTIFDTLLKRNLKLNPNHANAYIWNGSWDDVSGVGVEGITPANVELQDVGHANHVVNYIISAYEKGEASWTLVDIQRLCNTAKDIIYSYEDNNFVRNIDGTDIELDNGSSAYGNVGDGWVKLSKYDSGVEAVMKRFTQNNAKYLYLYQPIHFSAFFYGR